VQGHEPETQYFEPRKLLPLPDSDRARVRKQKQVPRHQVPETGAVAAGQFPRRLRLEPAGGWGRGTVGQQCSPRPPYLAFAPARIRPQCPGIPAVGQLSPTRQKFYRPLDASDTHSYPGRSPPTAPSDNEHLGVGGLAQGLAALGPAEGRDRLDLLSANKQTWQFVPVPSNATTRKWLRSSKHKCPATIYTGRREL
jgi:hypothetical protein